MTRFFAVLRRILLCGIAALLFALFLNGSALLDAILLLNVRGCFCLYLLLTPILYLLMVLVSVAYIRKHGQFAAVHQTHSFINTFFRCLGSDLLSPFKNIGYFFVALFNRNAIGREELFGRFFGMLLLFGVYFVLIAVLI